MLNDDTIVRDIAQGNVRVVDVVDTSARSVTIALDANTVLGVHHGRRRDIDAVDYVACFNGANRDAVATVAVA